jgi:outer membrane protein assembly factor BamB
VVAASAGDGARAGAYRVPTQREGGIWAPSGPAVDAAGDIFVATGNGSSTTAFDYGNSVLRLTPALGLADWFAPSDWATLSAGDTDLGSVGPALLDGGLVFQVGKAGVGYLLRAGQLGGIGGESFAGPVCASGAYGAAAYAAPRLYVPCEDGLAALQLSGPSFAVAWRGPRFNAGPPVVAGGAVWLVDQGSGALYALSAQDGSVLFQAARSQGGGPLPHFVTPAAGRGHVVVAGGRRVDAFGPS